MFDFIRNLLGLGGDEPEPPTRSADRDRRTDRSAGATGPLVRLVKTGPRKIRVVKALREATGASIAVSKAWADAPPVEVRTTDALAAEALVASVADAGGVAEAVEDAAPGTPPVPGEVAEAYTVTLQLNGVDAIRAIKAVREHTGLGLKASKQHVDQARSGQARLGPYPRESALALMMALNELGAVAEFE